MSLLNRWAVSNMKKPSRSAPAGARERGAVGIQRFIQRVSPNRGSRYTSRTNSPSLSQFNDVQDMMASLSRTG